MGAQVYEAIRYSRLLRLKNCMIQPFTVLIDRRRQSSIIASGFNEFNGKFKPTYWFLLYLFIDVCLTLSFRDPWSTK